MATDLRTRQVLDALDMAVTTRKPADVVHHSDQGSQYTSVAFGFRCKEAGVRPSTGSVGDAYDNAMAEAFFATLECELLDRRSFRSHPLRHGGRWSIAPRRTAVLPTKGTGTGGCPFWAVSWAPPPGSRSPAVVASGPSGDSSPAAPDRPGGSRAQPSTSCVRPGRGSARRPLARR